MNGRDTILNVLKTLPDTPGVYRMLNAKGEVLYVGKARSLKKRVANYTQLDKLVPRLQRMVVATASMEIAHTRTEAEALLLEANLIKSLKPRYNILLRDDKSFPYITLSDDHAFPRIGKHRGARKKGASYFGPYPSGLAVNETIATLQKVFLLRPCSDSFFAGRTRPCMEYQIKRCSGPCTGLISTEDYATQVQHAKDFLRGKSHEVQATLQQKMEAASATMEFELAGVYRDRIKALSAIQAKQAVNDPSLDDADIIAIAGEAGHFCIALFMVRGGLTLGTRTFFPAQTEGHSTEDVLEAFLSRFYQDHEGPKLLLLSQDTYARAVLEEALKVSITVPQKGTKRALVETALANAQETLSRKLRETLAGQELLERVAELFKIAQPIRRIEVFDNSHLFGTNAVGAMIVAGPEGFLRQEYRRFNVDAGEKTSGGDDFFMLKQVLTRRYGRLKREDAVMPDLVLIDGGAGQLTIAREVFAELGLELPFACIAKGPDRNAGREEFHLPGKPPFTLPSNDPALYYLQNLRDEAHRFAITGHRQKRAKNLTTSKLDDIPGIGAKRRRALLTHFGSARGVEEASLDELAAVAYVDKKIAKVIYSYLHPDD